VVWELQIYLFRNPQYWIAGNVKSFGQSPGRDKCRKHNHKNSNTRRIKGESSIASLWPPNETKLIIVSTSSPFNPSFRKPTLPPNKSELSFRPSIHPSIHPSRELLRHLAAPTPPKAKSRKKEKELEIEKSVVVDVISYREGNLGYLSSKHEPWVFCCAMGKTKKGKAI
jgi:hypothetical protein